MWFEVIGSISSIEVVATGRKIRELSRLRKAYGSRRWRKLKGIAMIRLADGSMRLAEVHWYESHGAGRFEIKVKRLQT
jgi:hypothetical protein